MFHKYAYMPDSVTSRVRCRPFLPSAHDITIIRIDCSLVARGLRVRSPLTCYRTLKRVSVCNVRRKGVGHSGTPARALATQRTRTRAHTPDHVCCAIVQLAAAAAAVGASRARQPSAAG